MNLVFHGLLFERSQLCLHIKDLKALGDKPSCHGFRGQGMTMEAKKTIRISLP